MMAPKAWSCFQSYSLPGFQLWLGKLSLAHRQATVDFYAMGSISGDSEVFDSLRLVLQVVLHAVMLVRCWVRWLAPVPGDG